MNFGDWQRRSIDGQLVALSNEFPGFYRYALIMEEASEAVVSQ